MQWSSFVCQSFSETYSTNVFVLPFICSTHVGIFRYILFFSHSFLYYFSTADVQIRQRDRSAQRWEDEGEESKAKQEWQEELR